MEDLNTKAEDFHAIGHLIQVNAAFLLMIGEKDQRVKPHYGGFMRNLKERGVECKYGVGLPLIDYRGASLIDPLTQRNNKRPTGLLVGIL